MWSFVRSQILSVLSFISQWNRKLFLIFLILHIKNISGIFTKHKHFFLVNYHMGVSSGFHPGFLTPCGVTGICPLEQFFLSFFAYLPLFDVVNVTFMPFETNPRVVVLRTLSISASVRKAVHSSSIFNFHNKALLMRKWKLTELCSSRPHS